MILFIPNIDNLNLQVFDTYDYLTFHTFDTGVTQYGVVSDIRYYPQHNHMAGHAMGRHCFCVR